MDDGEWLESSEELESDETEVEGVEHLLSVEVTGERLDRFVAAAVPKLTRSAVQRLIEIGEVTLNGTASRPAQKVRAGDEIRVRVPPPQPTTLTPENIPLEVLYEDADILVVNKAAGMTVHPGAGVYSGTLVNAVLGHCPDLGGIGGSIRPGIVHRLDKDTSGVMVVAKNDLAHVALQQQFKARTVHKIYVALLIGKLDPAEGLIDAPLGRHRIHRQRMAVVTDGRESRTRWKVQARYRDGMGRPYTLVEIHPETGRTHQIRVHFAWLGYPLVGDRVYGPVHFPLAAPRQFLHARQLRLRHPRTQETMVFEAPLPEDLVFVLTGLQRE